LPILPIANRLGVVHKVVIETLIKENTMSRTYNRRAAIAKRKRNEAIQDTAITIALVSGGLFVAIATVALGVGFGLMLAGAL
jgi:hypothetical protein